MSVSPGRWTTLPSATALAPTVAMANDIGSKVSFIGRVAAGIESMGLGHYRCMELGAMAKVVSLGPMVATPSGIVFFNRSAH
jgi:hypothetical protein